MDGLWGKAGDPVSWTFDTTASVGGRHHIVFDVASVDHDQGNALVMLFPCGTRARVMNGLPSLVADTVSLTVMNALLVDTVAMPSFVVDDQSGVFQHPRVHISDAKSVVEVCCGIGVGTTGLDRAGLQTVAVNDINGEFLRVFQNWHPGIPTVCGDIGNPQTVIDLWNAHPRCSTMMVGFSCQPFSAGGQQQGVEDIRSATLVAALRAAFWMRCHAIILECVPHAGTNRHVRMVIDSFCKQCHFHVAEVVLRQEQCWVSRRERWWAILSASIIGQVGVRPLPEIPYPSLVRHVLPHGIDMTDEELHQLLLSPEEHARLLEFVDDPHSLRLQMNGKAPTALHSWGSQFVACPCGCRVQGFADNTLATRGVYGLIIPAPGVTSLNGQEHSALRHPHPIEVALLNAVEVPPCWDANLRLVLAGLGQQACPIHSLWIAGHLHAHLERLQFGSTRVDCNAILDAHLATILDLAKTYMTPPALLDVQSMEIDPPCLECDSPLFRHPCCEFVHVGAGDEVTVVDADTLTCSVFRVSQQSTVQQFLAAEGGFDPDCLEIEVLNCHDACPLRSDACIAGKCLWVEKLSGSMDGVVQDAYGLTDEVAVSPTVPFVVEEMPEDGLAEPGHLNQEVASDSVAAAAHKGPSSDEVVPSDPLCSLHSLQLRDMLPPVVRSVAMVEALHMHKLFSSTRQQILTNQGSLWADDEVRWHVDQLLKDSGKVGWFQIDPLLLANCVTQNGIRMLSQWFSALPKMPSAFVGVVFLEGHWIPFVWTWTTEVLTASSWDVARPHHPGLSLLHDSVAKLVGARTHTVRTLLRIFASNDLCGVCAVRYLDSCIRGKMLPTQSHEVEFLHSVGRRLFCEMLASQAEVDRPWMFGAGLDSKAMVRLQDLLHQHGVPDAQIEPRSKLILATLDHQQLQQALTGSSPWRSVKALANQQKPVVQLVLPSELEAVVRQRADKGVVKGKKTKSSQGSNNRPVPPPALDPAKLALHEGAFVREDKSPLKQLPVSSIGPFAEGVVLATWSQVEGHLKAGTPVNNLALGVVVLNAEEKQMVTQLPWLQIRAVVRCQANSEPMIVPAYLVQLGNKMVHQASLSTFTEVPHVDAACVKLSIYRDEATGSWKDIVASPIRYLMHHLLPMNACEEAGSCECGKWHKGVAPVSEPVLDVWRRQWLNMSFHPVAQDQADIFVVNVRCVANILTQLLVLSGQSGIYVEPRTLDSKSPLLDFQVLWMPRVEHSELLRLKQINPLIQGLARMGSRLGLRVATTDASEVAKVVKPGSVVLAAGTRVDFEMGPMPFGMDRLTITKLCSNWGWQARPMYPSRTLENQIGTMWLLQAVTDPPQSVVAYKGGEIIITRLPSKPDQHSGVKYNQVVGSNATLAMCRMTEVEDSAGGDYVFKNDPWAAGLSKSASGFGSASDAMLGLQQAEKRIEQAILTKLETRLENHDSDMSQAPDPHGHTDDRLSALETQLLSLQTAQKSLDRKVDDNARRSDAQLHQLQLQVGAQLDSHSARMEDMFKMQMQTIESLLKSKKPRTE